MLKEMSAREVWRAVLGELQLQLPRPTFDTWLKQTEGVTYDQERFVVAAPTAFAIAWLERRMYQTIQQTVAKITQRELEIQFQTLAAAEEANDAYAEPPPVAASAPAPAPTPSAAAPSFSNKYTFKSFVAGPSNRLAFNAALAVAESPGKAYNPLFIYSGVGLGKTHLLHAIGHVALQKGLRARYVSAEQFTNEFISAIRGGTTEDFRNRYRSVEALLVDDVQFISGKEQTQEVFFHTFNDLHNAGHQIVLTSDRPPNSLALLEDRLRSRFQWGLIVDIAPPDLETRMAILRSKADQLRVSIDESVIELVAKRVQRNVRELEGSLNRLVAYSQLMSIPITLENTSRMLDDLSADTARHAIDPERIVDQVSRHYKVSHAELLGRSRAKKIAQARQVAMYLLIYELEMSPTEVGRLLGGRDHATVIHGAGKINGEINEDGQLRQDVLTIKEAIFT